MVVVLVCEGHPRRTRDLVTFTYTDANGFTYRAHHCPECAELELEESGYDWVAVPGGFKFVQPREVAA